jgi:hypothetical protein
MILNKDNALVQAAIAFLTRSLLSEELGGVKEIVLSIEITHEADGVAAEVVLRVDARESVLLGAGMSPLEALIDAASMFAGDTNGPPPAEEW